MDLTVLIGYFARQDEARKALREVAQQGFSRAALVHKGMDGEVHITDPFLWLRVLGGLPEWPPWNRLGTISSAKENIWCCSLSLLSINRNPCPAYIKGYPPGVRENGGQYTHAALWMVMAMARKGDGEWAVQLLRTLNPIEHARDAEAAWHYRVEPYVVAADIYRLPGRIGQGGWSWYTGSAAWMYRAWVEEVPGLQVRGGQMQVNPVIPATWPGFSLRYRHGEAALRDPGGESIRGCERGVAWVEMDGQRLPGGIISLERGLIEHRVTVRMGDSEKLSEEEKASPGGE